MLSRSTDRALVVDAVTVAGISVALCLTHSDLRWMSMITPAAMVVRMGLWGILVRRSQESISSELAWVIACILIGGLNDWNSVHRHRVYDYTADVAFPELSLVPIWMLLFWGMILRLIITLSRWDRLGPAIPSDTLYIMGRRFRSPWAVVAFQLVLVAVTRQTIYRTYMDPFASWLPFALALLAYGWVSRPRGLPLKLMMIALVVGPIVEILYVRVGGLHHYHLGWIGGVPIWIVLWWALAIPIFSECSMRLSLVGRAVPAT